MAVILEKSDDVIIDNVYQRNICKGEDRYFISKNQDIYAVFDGHGGSNISQGLVENIEYCIRKSMLNVNITDNNKIINAIIDSFKMVDSILMPSIHFVKPKCGSTCTMFLRIANKLALINLGDSNLVLYINGNKNIVMKEHTYSFNSEEKERIDKLVDNKEIKLIKDWKPKVLNSEDITMVRSNYICLPNYNSEQIAPTKSFGHYTWKKYNKMNVVPYIEIVEMIKGSTYEIVLMSDGVLDILASIDEIYPIISSSNNQSMDLVNFSENRWKQNWNYKLKGYLDQPNQNMDVDDITAIYCKIIF